ncbi:MAG TPA: alkaline phosphatase family protein, partial [Opitutaceae bacterium]
MNSCTGSPLRLAVSFAMAAVFAAAVAASAPPTVLLISIDGFRWDYPEMHPCPAIRGIIAHGVRAEGLVPCYPSYTFPNHYSIVTGLRPESHGIIGNNMFEPEWDAWFGIGS